MDLENMFKAIREAEEQIIACFIREGCSPDEAKEEARDLISIPQFWNAPEKDITKFIASLGEESIPSEFLDIIQDVNLGTTEIWDAILQPGFFDENADMDPYLATVVSETLELRDKSTDLERGIVVGSTQLFESIVLYKDADEEGYRVGLVDSETGDSIIMAASSLKAFLAANALLEAQFSRRQEQGGPRDFYWKESILSEMPDGIASRDWLYYSLSSRPRPI